MSHTQSSSQNWKSLLALSFGALGVVYGDIGTSPLYAMKEIFFGPHQLQINTDSILGVASVVFWALTIIVLIKYVFFVLRADNDGEGGVFALYSLLEKVGGKKVIVLSTALILAAGLLFGDGVITPAISVLSAVEGLQVVSPQLASLVIPITISILIALFSIQKGGTHKIGKIFGPTVFVWFLAISALGLKQIVGQPQVLFALNPLYAARFLFSHSPITLMAVLGSVMLVVTGGEAMYADMGHFGKKPIRLSWLAIVYPALILNYFGQAAYLLSGAEVIHENLFYSLVPSPLIVPMILLATAATIIASQALITGAFSLASQAINLGLIPHLRIKHTHRDHEGQLYVGAVNWLLLFGCIVLVFAFKNSGNLAAAYGLAVSGVMLITTLSMVVIAEKSWGWKKWMSLSLFGVLAVIDLGFLLSNSLKLFLGGWVPLVIAAVILIVMTTWKWGRKRVNYIYDSFQKRTVLDLIEIKKSGILTLPKTVLMMTPAPVISEADQLPLLEQLFWKRFASIPEHLIFVTVLFDKKPFATKRWEYIRFYSDKKLGSISSIILHYGFMEEAKVEKALLQIANKKDIPLSKNTEDWFVHIIQERTFLPKMEGMSSILTQLRYSLFKVIHRNSDTADHYLELGQKVQLSIESVPVAFKIK